MLRELTILNFNILTTFVINKSEKGLDICGYLIINKTHFFTGATYISIIWCLGSGTWILFPYSSFWILFPQQSQERVYIRNTDVSNENSAIIVHFQVVTLRIGSQTDGFLFVQNVSLVSAFGLMLYERGDYDNKS